MVTILLETHSIKPGNKLEKWHYRWIRHSVQIYCVNWIIIIFYYCVGWNILFP